MSPAPLPANTIDFDLNAILHEEEDKDLVSEKEDERVNNLVNSAPRYVHLCAMALDSLGSGENGANGCSMCKTRRDNNLLRVNTIGLSGIMGVQRIQGPRSLLTP